VRIPAASQQPIATDQARIAYLCTRGDAPREDLRGAQGGVLTGVCRSTG
jgi:hypothetical protein